MSSYQLSYLLLSRIAKWTKKSLFAIFLKKKEHTFEDNEDITITNVVTSVTKDITNAELSFAVDEIKNHTVNLSSIRSKFQKM